MNVKIATIKLYVYGRLICTPHIDDVSIAACRVESRGNFCLETYIYA